jgi:hypothetical protein
MVIDKEFVAQIIPRKSCWKRQAGTKHFIDRTNNVVYFDSKTDSVCSGGVLVLKRTRE